MTGTANENGMLTAEINPAALMQFTGIKTAEIGLALCQSRLLRPTLEHWLAETLPALPDELETGERDLFAHLQCSGAQGLEQVARSVALLINHRLIFLATDGALLRVLVQWCGCEKVVRHAATAKIEGPQAISPLSAFDQNDLMAQSRRIMGGLLGAMPEGYRARLTLRCDPESLPGIQRLTRADQKNLISLAMKVSAFIVEEAG